MSRRNDWQDRLVAYLHRIKSTPFDYGQMDCALFCAGAVHAMTGMDHAKGKRGYTTKAAGLRILEKAGFADHVAYVAAHFDEIAPLQASPGDLALMPGASLGVVQGAMVYVMTDGGVGVARLSTAERAFKV